ncbi:MAG TPA: hypothetical protein VMG11_10105 [Steroidobacteraceae bacterium]|nr:hypothetical protein [Steroidobacteraceae bacterium]
MSAKIQTLILKGMGAEPGADHKGNKLMRLTLEGVAGEVIHAVSLDPDFPMKLTGTLFKVAADEIARSALAALAAAATGRSQTHTALAYSVLGTAPGRVLMITTTDKQVLKISLSDTQADSLGEHLK